MKGFHAWLQPMEINKFEATKVYLRCMNVDNAMLQWNRYCILAYLARLLQFLRESRKKTWRFFLTNSCLIFTSPRIFLLQLDSTVLATWKFMTLKFFPALLALYERNLPVTSRFPSQRASDMHLWCFFVFKSEHAVETNNQVGDLKCHCSQVAQTINTIVFI